MRHHEMSNQDRNKEIGKFMYRIPNPFDDGRTYVKGYSTIIDGQLCAEKWVPLTYDKDWNEIMEVIFRIIKLRGVTVNINFENDGISKEFCRITWGEKYYSFFSDNPLIASFVTVGDFCKEYNEAKITDSVI